MSYANTYLKIFHCDYAVHYNEKEYKCNKNIPDLKIIFLGIFLSAISMHYIQLADHGSEQGLTITGK